MANTICDARHDDAVISLESLLAANAAHSRGPATMSTEIDVLLGTAKQVEQAKAIAGVILRDGYVGDKPFADGEICRVDRFHFYLAGG